MVIDWKGVFLFLMSIDYVKKAKIIKSGLCKKVKKFNKELYQHYCEGDFDAPYYEMMFCIENGCSLEDLEEARKINNSNYHRLKRLNERIEKYLSMGECIWLTLTFDEQVLSNTTEQTRKEYVRKFLKSQSSHYVANIDYGDTTEREHYHAIVVSSFVDMTKWPYGFAYTERIKNHIKTPLKMAKYVSKLTNHAIKESTRRSCYLYSR